MTTSRWILVLATVVSVAGCNKLFESSEHKLFRQYNEAMNTFCDKVDKAKTPAEFKEAMEWMARVARPMASKIRSLSLEDPQAFAKVMVDDPELATDTRKTSARVAATMMIAMTRTPGGESMAGLRGLYGDMLGQPAPREDDLAKKARGLLQKVLGQDSGGVTPPPTPQKPGSWKPPPTIVDVRRSGGPVGVAECDRFLEKLRACIERVPYSRRQTLQDLARQWTGSWSASAGSFAGRRALKTICTRQRETQAKALGGFGCTF